MYRSLPVGNKVCAARVRKRYEDQRAQRLKEMKPQIDTRPPETTGMPHLRINYKRDEMLNYKHDIIERDNRTMLTKMHDMARKTELPRSTSLPLLRNEAPGGPAQQREYDRITQDNYKMLNRLNNMQGQLNVRRFEENWAQSQNYLKLACDYPPILQKKKVRSRRTPSRAGLTRLPAEQVPPMAYAEDPHAVAGGPDDIEEAAAAELRYVLREQRPIGSALFFVEMATDGRSLAVSIYDASNDDGFELLVSEDNHRALLEESGGDYALIADRLQVDGDRLIVVPLQAEGSFAGDPSYDIRVQAASSSSQAGPAPPPPRYDAEDPISSSVVDVQDDDDVALAMAGDAAAPMVEDVVHQASTEESATAAATSAAAAASAAAASSAAEGAAGARQGAAYDEGAATSDDEVEVDAGSDSGQSL